MENKHSLILCYFDLDNLKTINDSYGHKAGDEYILLAVEAIRQKIRANDLLCRMGGDEFIALLPNCTLEKGAHICSRRGKLADSV
ncbi:GGDEF domain-containing protein [Desulfopila sp. IMCC35008]|uniref:GGDEF domain-containing protein n=1 Tax=Desulfopila sp. IMCC35008 TaxID=2653858 RepID=UPI001F0E661F|nr:GGDEF domain-containing protein [Desulfopila sp. IMCC35008]